MNICLLTSTFLPLVGGLEIVVHHLATALTQVGHHVVVVTPRPSNRRVEDRFAYPIVRFGFKGYGRLNLVTASAVMTLAYVVSRHHIDVINVHNVFKPASWAYLHNRYVRSVPIVGTPHGDDIQVKPEINWGVRLDPERNAIVERNLRCFTRVTAISQPIAMELERAGIDPASIHRIPNGIWTHQYGRSLDKADIRQALGLPLSPILAVSVGRNHPVKGYRYGLEAIADLRRRGVDIAYVIVGRDMSGIVDRARELGIVESIITPGEVEPTRIPAYLQAADIFVSSSIVESFGMTTLEAMSSGLPCVVTESAGVTDLIDAQCGMIVKPEDSGHLARALQQLIDNPDLRKRMGESSSARSKQYDWPVVAGAYVAAYRQAIHSHASSDSKPW